MKTFTRSERINYYISKKVQLFKALVKAVNSNDRKKIQELNEQIEHCNARLWVLEEIKCIKELKSLVAR